LLHRWANSDAVANSYTKPDADADAITNSNTNPNAGTIADPNADTALTGPGLERLDSSADPDR
jgi:hypothetical protein